MIEVYRNTTGWVSHTVYYEGAPVEVDDDDVQVEIYAPQTNQRWSVQAESMNLGRYRFRIPSAATKYDGLIKTFWKFTYEGEEVVEEEDVEIVTPYVSFDEITSAYPELYNKNYEELRMMERRVRLMIDKITGQSFGVRTKSIVLNGQADTYAMPERLYHVHYFSANGQHITGSELHQHIHILNDGWRVQVTFPAGWYHVKSDTLYRRGGGGGTVVLHGSFGWPAVPNDVNMAALMLIGDYFCKDAVYRQKGVQAVRAADWRLDYHDKAFEGTGNLDVDLLLSKYLAYNMVII